MARFYMLAIEPTLVAVAQLVPSLRSAAWSRGSQVSDHRPQGRKPGLLSEQVERAAKALGSGWRTRQRPKGRAALVDQD